MNESLETAGSGVKARKVKVANKKRWLALAVAGLLLISGGSGAWAYAGAKADREATAAYYEALETSRAQADDSAGSLLDAHAGAVESQSERIADLEALYEDSTGKVADEDVRQALREALDTLIDITTIEPALETQTIVVAHERDSENYSPVEFAIAHGISPGVGEIEAAGDAAQKAGDAVTNSIDEYLGGELASQIEAAQDALENSEQADENLRKALEDAIKNVKDKERLGEMITSADIQNLEEAIKQVVASHDQVVQEALAAAQAEAEARRQALESANTNTRPNRPATPNSNTPSPPPANTGDSSSSNSGEASSGDSSPTPEPSTPEPTPATPSPEPTTPSPTPEPTTPTEPSTSAEPTTPGTATSTTPPSSSAATEAEE